jgi:glyoxylase-like metal-dependent hydrolase (beta-lactamase superfamily II)
MNSLHFKSDHFTLYHLATGIYTAIGSSAGGAYSNAGIVDLGNATLVFDTFMTPLAAKDLRKAAEELTGRPVRWVLISHAHSDHWGGNQVFTDQATILATHQTRQVIPAASEYLREYQTDPSLLQNEIQEDEKRLEIETDPNWRSALESSIPRRQYLLQSLPNLTIHLPDQTFEGSLGFHGTKRVAEFYSAGLGHTTGDAYLLLPAERIIFLGDLGFFQSQPFMPFSHPEAWVARIDELTALDLAVYVPGHGPIGSKDDLLLQKNISPT